MRFSTIHQLNLLILVAALCLGCTRPPIDHKGLQTEIDNIAKCFEHSVFLLQEAPDSKDDVGEFLKRGQTLALKSADVPETCDFSKLHWDQGQTRIQVSSGQNVHCSIEQSEHDNLVTGAVFRTSYKFKLPNTPCHSTATADLSLTSLTH